MADVVQVRLEGLRIEVLGCFAWKEKEARRREGVVRGKRVGRCGKESRMDWIVTKQARVFPTRQRFQFLI